jgi:hypothetical protein
METEGDKPCDTAPSIGRLFVGLYPFISPIMFVFVFGIILALCYSFFFFCYPFIIMSKLFPVTLFTY